MDLRTTAKRIAATATAASLVLAVAPAATQDCELEVLGFIESPGAWAVDVVGRHAVVLTAAFQGPIGLVEIIDIADPYHPVSLGTTPGSGLRIKCEGSLAFVADGWGLRIFDLSEPTSPVDLGGIVIDGVSGGVDSIGRIVFLSSFVSQCGLAIVDASAPGNPTLLGCSSGVAIGADVVATDGLAVVADGRKLLVISHSDPHHPVLVGDLGFSNVNEIALSQGFVYAIDCEVPSVPTGGQLSVISTADPTDPVVIGQLAIRPGMLATSDHYASVSHGFSLDALDISDPYNPKVIGTFERPLEELHAAVIREPYLYVAGMGGLYILDLSSCPAATPCNAADFAPPFGVLDQADVAAFVGAFLSGDPAADLDANTIHELRDLIAFVDAFVSGCP